MSDLITVLYAEDEEDIRQVTEFALEDEGFELVLCPTGEVAVKTAPTIKPDLILLDVMMPGIDGPTTLEKLREMPHLKSTPAIFMTAKVQPTEVEKYKQMGAIGVIAKPFDPMSLADEIHSLLASQDDE